MGFVHISEKDMLHILIMNENLSSSEVIAINYETLIIGTTWTFKITVAHGHVLFYLVSVTKYTFSVVDNKNNIAI